MGRVLDVVANTSDGLAQYYFVVVETSFGLQLLNYFSLRAARTLGLEVSYEPWPYMEVKCTLCYRVEEVNAQTCMMVLWGFVEMRRYRLTGHR